jgi:hypothetical protein
VVGNEIPNFVASHGVRLGGLRSAALRALGDQTFNRLISAFPYFILTQRSVAMKPLALLAALMISSLTFCTAQPPDTLWTRTFGGEGNQIGRSIARTVDGGYMVAAQSGGFLWNGGALWLIRLDENFDVIWERTYDQVQCGPACVRETIHGRFLIAADRSFLRVDSLGAIQQLTVDNGSAISTPRSLQAVSGGNFVLTGWETVDIPWPPIHSVVVMERLLTPNGAPVWSRPNLSRSGIGLAIATFPTGTIMFLAYSGGEQGLV